MDEKEKHIYISSLAFFTSCFFICLIIFLIYKLGNNAIDKEYILNTFALNLCDFIGENTEKYSYMISAVTYPIIFFLSYMFFKKIIKNFSEIKLKIITCIEIILGIAAVPVFTAFSEMTRDVYYPKYSNFLIPVFALIIFTYLFFLYNRSKKIALIVNIFTVIMILLYISVIFMIYHTPTYAISPADTHHFEAYFYPIYKTISGMTPGVDFNNIYGFYPLIYSLFFNMNNISVQNFSLFIAVLVSLIFTFLAFILFSNIKNKILAFCIFNICIIYSLFATFNYEVFSYGAFYLQYEPHRVFFVMLICALITLYLKIENERTKRIIEYLGYIISSIALFWNLESGVAALAGWSSLHFYLSLNKPDRFKLIAKVFIKAVLSGIFALFLIFIVTYIHSAKFINPLGMFYGPYVFYSKGFFMLTMNIIEQPFVLIVAIYFIAFADSIKSAVERNISNADAIKFTFAVIGFAIFSYFQGRSHGLCLVACSWPAYIIIGLLIEKYYQQYINYKNSEEKTGLHRFLTASYLTKFSLFYILAVLITAYTMIYMFHMPENIKMIKSISNDSFQVENLKLLDKSEQYDILTGDSSFYYMSLKQPNLLPFPNLCDCFLQKDFETLDEYLSKSDKKLVIDNSTLEHIWEGYFKNNYNLIKANDSISVYERKH